MARSLEFTIAGPIETTVIITEVVGADGFIDLVISIEADESGGANADLRGLFFNVSNKGLLPSLSADGTDVTDSQFMANKVDDLGNGANLKGALTAKGNRFDAGVEFGTQGIGKDDIDTTTFTLSADGADVTLDDLGGERIGVRYTSFGFGGDREGSLKIAGLIPHAPDAVDDLLTTDEDTADTINLLGNDTDGDGDTLFVTDIEGGAVGTAFMVTSDGGRIGELTVLADGTATFDPNGNFEDLSTGDTDTLVLDYTISDGNGGSDWAELSITVTGVNDAPVANNDGAFFVEYGDAALVDVLANDSDIDGTIDPTSLSFAGADAGVAIEVGGQLQYTANAIPYDLTDSSISDGLTYTVQDNEGATSNTATVIANVIDPLREADTDSVNAASNGQLLTLSLATEDRTYNDTSFAEVSIIAGALVQPDVNVSFALDESGSVSAAQFVEERDAVQSAINELRTDFGGSGTNVRVQLIEFASNANSQVFDLFDPILDDISTGTPYATKSGGGTDFQPALQQALNFFNAEDPGNTEEDFLLFVSDGQAPNNFGAQITGLEAQDVSISAIGFGGGVNLGQLNLIDNTGSAEQLNDASELTDAFAASPLFPADLLDFSLLVDGTEVADEANLTALGGGDFELDLILTNLLHGLGDTNTVQAIASFDTDNDGVADETLTAQTVINGTDGTDIIFA